MDDLTRNLLLRDEGYRRTAYTDSLGYLTIGIGRCIDARKGGGISPKEAFFLLEQDVDTKSAELDARLPWWRTLDPVRQAVLVSMAFQLGTAGLLGFVNTLEKVRTGDYASAAMGMLGSRWAQQVPLRAHRLAEAMRTGDAAAFMLDEDPPPPVVGA